MRSCEACGEASLFPVRAYPIAVLVTPQQAQRKAASLLYRMTRIGTAVQSPR